MSDGLVEPGGTGGAEGTPTADYSAGLEEALLQAGALIDSTVLLHRQRSGLPTPVARTGGVPIGHALESLIGRTRHTVCVALTETGEFADVVVRSLTRISDRAAVRILCTAEATDSALTRLAQLADSRLEVRVSESELRETLVVDGVAALVRGAEGAGGQAAIVNDAAAVRALELLFAGAWSRGRRLADHLQLSPRLRTELARNILERLRAGNTDETAARDLNVSLRTYRRYVAEIMRELDAHSRFQAGVRAVEFGLLSE
ncbi:LuxR C-terminal-related transcriptional regulator [Streptomyces sp. NPDC048751]|uniref:helix-turn-helix transcriptional regulator n=1 Tax=Streptomyces sp. NPDC048751 TaxID=3365591 RepID=UPI003720E16B